MLIAEPRDADRRPGAKVGGQKGGEQQARRKPPGGDEEVRGAAHAPAEVEAERRKNGRVEEDRREQALE